MEILEPRIVLAATPLAVAPAAVQPAPTTIFSDTFDNGPSPLWGNERGSWAAAGGAYAATAPTAAPLAFTSLPFDLTDFAIDLDVNAVDDGGIWLRADAAGDSGVLLVTGGHGGRGTGLYWHMIQGSTSGVALSAINEQDGLFSPGDNIHLHVTVVGDTYSAYLNGSSVPATTITTADFPSGRVALYDNGSERFDNVNVTTALAPGSADPTFNAGQSVGLGFAAQASVVTPAGQTLLAGLGAGPGGAGSQGVLERLNADGSVDASFGPGGTVADSASTAEAFYGVATESDGTVVAVGAGDGNLLLAGYHADGSPDTSFGSAGRVLVPVAGAADATAFGVTLDSAGNLVVVGSAGGRFLADRFTGRGAQDPEFNGGSPLLLGNASDNDVLGKVVTGGGGSIVATGASAGTVVVARLTAGGTPDPSFGTGGVANVPGLAAPSLVAAQSNPTEGLALDSQGGILVANTTGTGGAPGDFATARLLPSGAPDPAFGANGVVTTDFGGDDDADAVAIQPDGSQVLVSGTSTSNGVVQEAVAAYLPDGQPDPSFGTGGKELLPTGVTVTPALRPGPPGASGPQSGPQAQGIGEIVEAVFGTLQPGAALAQDKLVLGIGAGRQGATTAPSPPSGTVIRLLAPATSPAPLPQGPTLGAAVSAKLPAAVIAGAKANATATLEVSNTTAQTFSGPVTVALYLSPARSLSGATRLASVNQKLRLKGHAKRAVRFRLSSFPSLPAGSYYLVAAVTAPDGSVTGAAGPSLTVAPAFVSVAVSGLRPSPASVAPGKQAFLSLTLQDKGNAPAAGTTTLTVTAFADPTGAGGTTLASVPLRVKLRPGASGRYRVKLAVPASLPAGSYSLTADLDVAALGDDNASDGNAQSAVPLTVK